MPSMPALSSSAASALACSSAANTGAHEARQIRARRDQRVERLEIGLHLVDGLALERQLEQRGGVTPRHAGYDFAFACHAPEPSFL